MANKLGKFIKVVDIITHNLKIPSLSKAWSPNYYSTRCAFVCFEIEHNG